MNHNKHAKRGVTLVEIAIVLVIIGLLLGGVLKGQELINNAKVRSIADRQNSVKVAWFAFIDRYGAMPGDYIEAAAHVPGGVNGDGDGTIDADESPLVFQHLTGSGYLRCSQCTAVTTETPAANNSLVNQYGGIMAIWHNDLADYAAVGGALTTNRRLFIHTGPFLPSNIIAEIDRKLDDGIANTGDMVFSRWSNDATVQAVPVDTQCMALGISGNLASAATGGKLDTAFPQFWRGAAAAPPVEQNCGAVVAI